MKSFMSLSIRFSCNLWGFLFFKLNKCRQNFTKLLILILNSEFLQSRIFISITSCPTSNHFPQIIRMNFHSLIDYESPVEKQSRTQKMGKNKNIQIENHLIVIKKSFKVYWRWSQNHQKYKKVFFASQIEQLSKLCSKLV